MPVRGDRHSTPICRDNISYELHIEFASRRRAAESVLWPDSGDCAPRHHYVNGPTFTRFDMSIAKRVAFTTSVTFDLRIEVLLVITEA